jgi:hypothetical protein
MRVGFLVCGKLWPVRKKTKGQIKDFPSSTLYLSELEEILAIFHDGPGTTTISDNDFEYESIAELKSKRGSEPEKLVIERDGLVLRIGNGKTNLSSAGSVIGVGHFAQIQDILNSHRRPIYFLLNKYSALLAVVVGFIPGFLLSLPRWITGTTFLLMLVFAFIALINNNGGYTRIRLVNRHEEQSFFKRNQDAIIVGTISTIVSSILSFVVAYLLFRQGIK